MILKWQPGLKDQWSMLKPDRVDVQVSWNMRKGIYCLREIGCSKGENWGERRKAENFIGEE